MTITPTLDNKYSLISRVINTDYILGFNLDEKLTKACADGEMQGLSVNHSFTKICFKERFFTDRGRWVSIVGSVDWLLSQLEPRSKILHD